MGLGNYHLSRPDIFGCSLSLCVNGSDYARATVRDCQWSAGILFKSGTHLETIGRVRRSLWTKPAPLPQANCKLLRHLRSQPNLKIESFSRCCSGSFSEHPVGQAIVRAAQQQRLELPAATGVQAETGRRYCWRSRWSASGEWSKATFIHQLQSVPSELSEWSEYLETEGKTVVWVADTHQVLGVIAVADTVRLKRYQWSRN